MHILSALKKLRRQSTRNTALIEIRISQSALLHNLGIFQKRFPNVAIAPVLKSNAYGAGLVEIASLFEGLAIPFLCVDSYYEALTIRREGIKTPILVMGYTPAETMERHWLPEISFSILSLSELERLAALRPGQVRIHLKIDTGMHRHGIMLHEINRALALIARSRHIMLEGAYSHLANADTQDSPHNRTQIAAWNSAVQTIRALFPDIRYLHCAATAGSFHAPDIEANAMRIGKGLHGFANSIEKFDLRPILEMRTRISSLRTVAPGEYIGYSSTRIAEKEMHIATIPAGYYEGIDRRLSNKGFILVHDTPCPIVGRVSMNITSIDVSALAISKPDEEARSVRLDDTAIIISANPSDPNSIENIAMLCGTIPHDILVHVPPHLRRTIVE